MGVVLPVKSEQSPGLAAGTSMTSVAQELKALIRTMPEKEHAPQVKKRRIVSSDDEGEVPSEDDHVTWH